MYGTFIDRIKDLKIRHKLFLGFGIVLILILSVGVYTIISMSKIHTNEEKIRDFYYPAADAAMEVKFAVVQVQQFLTDASATGSKDGFDEAVKFAAIYKENSEILKELYKDDPVKLQHIKEMDADFEEFYTTGQKMAMAYITQGREAGNLMMGEFDRISKVVQKHAVMHEKEAVDALEMAITQNSAIVSNTRKTIFLLVALVAGFSLVIGYFVVNSVASPLETLRKDADIIAEGEYNHRINVPETKDEIGQLSRSIKRMVNSITAALSESNKLLAGIGEPFRVVDRDFNVVKANPKMMEITGTSEGEKIKCYQQLEGEYCHTENCTLRQVLAGNEMVKVEIDKTTRDGRVIPMLLTATPWRDEKGNVVGVIEFFVDITENKKLRKEQEEARQYLESQVDRILPAIEALANGDLSHGELEIIKDDAINKIAAAVNKANRNLKSMLLKLREAAIKLASTSEELAASSQEMNASTEQISQAVQQIAQGAQNTASQVDRGSRGIKRLSDIINSVAESAGVAAEIAKKAEESAKEGGKSAEAAARKMAAILEVTEDTTTKVRELGNRSKEISKIVEVISSIAEQTNLLALNAAIEAARAGEHGKGFAVVAEEVRKLAEDSSKAAEKIEDLIKEIQAEIDRAVQGMERGAIEVSEGSEVVNKALNALGGIVASVSEATTRMLEITKAAQEQKGISGEMVTIIEQVAAVAEETAAGAEEASAATEEQTASMEELTASAQELAKLANDLQEIVNSFKIDGVRTDFAKELPARLA